MAEAPETDVAPRCHRNQPVVRGTGSRAPRCPVAEGARPRRLRGACGMPMQIRAAKPRRPRHGSGSSRTRRARAAIVAPTRALVTLGPGSRSRNDGPRGGQGSAAADVKKNRVAWLPNGTLSMYREYCGTRRTANNYAVNNNGSPPSLGTIVVRPSRLPKRLGHRTAGGTPAPQTWRRAIITQAHRWPREAHFSCPPPARGGDGDGFGGKS